MEELDFEHFIEWMKEQEQILHQRCVFVCTPNNIHIEMNRHNDVMNSFKNEEVMKHKYEIYKQHVSNKRDETMRKHQPNCVKDQTPIIRSQRPVVRRDIPIPGR